MVSRVGAARANTALPANSKDTVSAASFISTMKCIRVQGRAMDGSLHPCRNAKQSVQTEAAGQGFSYCIAGICWHKALNKACMEQAEQHPSGQHTCGWQLCQQLLCLWWSHGSRGL